jgi:hypothetical protein
MSMNKTCPISNFTSEEPSDRIRVRTIPKLLIERALFPTKTSLSRTGGLWTVASLQLGQKLRWIHSARVDEALVPRSILLHAHDLKSARKVPKRPFEGGQWGFLSTARPLLHCIATQ